MQKRISSIRVVEAGSAPDIDSDIHTAYRDSVLAHCEELYGRGTLANIVTFTTLAAKASFKIMCTIYEVPFSQANKIASFIPGPVDGKDCKIADLFDPKSKRYSEGVDFRNATSGSEWTAIIEGAIAIEGRVRATGVHPCGVVLSSKPLNETIPLQIRQADGRVVTQWTYPELESMGLIKFDLLGLDTVDLIANTITYIQKSGKTPPNMVEIIHGKMDDKKTYDMLSRGETDGIFQLSSQGVKDLLKRMKPTEIDDIIATTALYRPGPMGMKSHIKYADRKNAREKLDYPIHKDFKGTELEEILEKTYYLCVYQEQVMQIANRIGGMTLQEGDKLRKAMGKKEMSIMAKMKPLFISGGKALGHTEDGLLELWATMEVFAEYGFNKSHSVAYAMNAYQAAYLKANYPVEFMAALLAQNISKKDKILAFLQESRRMKIKVGAVDINLSDVKVAPDYSKKSGFDILYGLSGVNGVSEDTATIIVDERERGGRYTSVQDLINRCLPLGVNNKKIYENLALAGAFDFFKATRKDVVDNLPLMLTDSKVTTSKGASLFDLFDDAPAPATELNSGEEYPYVEKLNKEANVIGLFLTGHPLDKAGNINSLRTATIDGIFKKKSKGKHRIVGCVTEVTAKRMKRGGKMVSITIDDGTNFITANLDKAIVKGIDKRVAQLKVKSLYINNSNEVSPEIEELATTNEFEAMDEIQVGQVYSFEVAYRPETEDAPYIAKVFSTQLIELADDGSLPVRIRLKDNVSEEEKRTRVAAIKEVCSKFEGDSPIFIGYWDKVNAESADAPYLAALDYIKTNSTKVGDTGDETGHETLVGGKAKAKQKKNKDKNPWPPQKSGGYTKSTQGVQPVEQLRKIEYTKTPFTVAKTSESARAIEKIFGIENYDFGLFDERLLD